MLAYKPSVQFLHMFLMFCLYSVTQNRYMMGLPTTGMIPAQNNRISCSEDRYINVITNC